MDMLEHTKSQFDLFLLFKTSRERCYKARVTETLRTLGKIFVINSV